jgi:hypothetical protein
MAKQVGEYIMDCLRALNREEGEVELGTRIREIREYWQTLWGGAVPAPARIVAAYLSNDSGSTEPKDLWLFTENHCMVTRNVLAGNLDLSIYTLHNGVRRMRIAKNYTDQPVRGSRLVVGLWFDEESKALIEAADGNCISLETLLEEVLIPRLG